MHCLRCQYLLWNLPETRCPECGLAFDVTDYTFRQGGVEFCCPSCEQAYPGEDARGLPVRHRSDCHRCGTALDVSCMIVRPLDDAAIGEPLGLETPWSSRHRLGLARAFCDALPRLVMQPAEFFRRAGVAPAGGSALFSIFCAYLSAAVFIAVLWVLQTLGFIAWGANAQALARPRWLLAALVAIPMTQLAWNYIYGAFIHAVLRGLGARRAELDRCVDVVAYGSAVTPALLLVPPVGIAWYLGVIVSGIEQLFGTTRPRALLAGLLPLLLFGHMALAALFVMLYT